MQITTAYFEQLNLHEVKELLPPKHHLQAFDHSLHPGEQPDGKYFVFSLNTFWGKREETDCCLARITLHDVLEDCSPEERTSVDGLVHGAFCEAIENPISGELGYKGIWSEKSSGKIQVWLVVHHISVYCYPWTKEDHHPFLVVIDPNSCPQCEMWVMVGVLQDKSNPTSPTREDSPHLALSPVCTETAQQPPRTPSPASPIQADAPPLAHSPMCTEPAPKPPRTPSPANPTQADVPPLACSPVFTEPAPKPPRTPSPASPTQADSPPLAHSPVFTEPAPKPPTTFSSPSIRKPPTRASGRPPASVSGTVPSLAHPPVRAEPVPKSPRMSSSPSRRRPSAPASVRSVAPVPTTAQASRPRAPDAVRDQGSFRPKDKKWKLTPLKEAHNDVKISTAGILVKVLKENQEAKNGTIYDILMVTADGLAVSTSSMTHINVKVFHNDNSHWCEGLVLQRGQVLMFQEMSCKTHNGNLEGILYNTRMCCVVSCNEKKELTWYEHPKSRFRRQNIVNAERKAMMLFEWWNEWGERFTKYNQSITGPSKQAAPYPTCTLAQAGGKGHFNLFCQVVKKTIHNTRAVLRVSDGTSTQYRFEEITSDPTKKVEDYVRVFPSLGSVEVDILMYYEVLPLELEDLQEEQFVELQGVECRIMQEQCRQLIFVFPEGKIRVLDDDEPQRQIIMDALDGLREAEAERDEDNDGVSMADSEEEVSEEIPNDSFQEFVEKQGFKRSSRYHDRSAKKQRLDTTLTSGTHPQNPPSTPERPLRDASQKPHTPKHLPKEPHHSAMDSLSNYMTFQSPSPSRQSYHTPSPQPRKHTPLPNSPSPTKQSLHASSPQPRQHTPLSSCPSPSKQPLHALSPQPSISRQPEQACLANKPCLTTKQGSQGAPRSQEDLSYPSASQELNEELQKYKRSKSRNAISGSQQQQQAHHSKPSLATDTTQEIFSFHTEVRSEAKESSLEDFYLSGKVGEMCRVKAAIKDFRTIKQKNSTCDKEHACLHQWLWGLCSTCSRTFSSYYLSLLMKSSLPDSNHHLPCPHCLESNNDGGSQARRRGVIKPMLKMKMVIMDPNTGLQLTPSLVGDHANLFFNVKPTFKWLTEKPEVQGIVEALVLQKNPPLDLGLKKMALPGKLKLYIVNTVLYATSYLQSSPLISVCPQSPSATPPGPGSPASSHPDSPSPVSPHPDAPSDTPSQHQAPVSPCPQSLVGTEEAPVRPSLPHLPHTHSQSDPVEHLTTQSNVVNPPQPSMYPTSPPHPQSPPDQDSVVSPPQPEQQRKASAIPSKLISPKHSQAKTHSAPTTPSKHPKHQKTPPKPHSCPTTPTKQPTTPAQPQSSISVNNLKKYKTLPQSHSSPTKHSETQYQSDSISPTQSSWNTPPEAQSGPVTRSSTKAKTIPNTESATSIPSNAKPNRTPSKPHSDGSSPLSQSHEQTLSQDYDTADETLSPTISP